MCLWLTPAELCADHSPLGIVVQFLIHLTVHLHDSISPSSVCLRWCERQCQKSYLKPAPSFFRRVKAVRLFMHNFPLHRSVVTMANNFLAIHILVNSFQRDLIHHPFTFWGESDWLAIFWIFLLEERNYILSHTSQEASPIIMCLQSPTFFLQGRLCLFKCPLTWPSSNKAKSFLPTFFQDLGNPEGSELPVKTKAKIALGTSSFLHPLSPSLLPCSVAGPKVFLLLLLELQQPSLLSASVTRFNCTCAVVFLTPPLQAQ